MQEITVQELKKMLDNKEDFQLIDVREEYEYEWANLGGELIPLGTIVDNLHKIKKNKKVIIHCKSGARSSAVIDTLEKQFGYTNLINLKGGIMAYINEIDSSIIK
ncbi:MAG: rhodanese-like domain-containing protein [Bacteroidia bacterium]